MCLTYSMFRIKLLSIANESFAWICRIVGYFLKWVKLVISVPEKSAK